MRRIGGMLVLLGWLASGCGDDTQPAAPDAGGGADAAACVPMPGTPDGGSCAAQPSSNIHHVVVIVQENHSFDSYFANYCTAPPGSNPTCTTGPACCEGGPAMDPASGATPLVLDDAQTAAYDPDHLQDCELLEIDGGRMDGFVTGPCGDRKNFAYAPATLVAPYHDLARRYALADRYFQPIAGQSSSNDMYFARARYVFTDNQVAPMSIGSTCGAGSANGRLYDDPTLVDLLQSCGITWAAYMGGYAHMVQAVTAGGCPAPEAGCPANWHNYPCIDDPSDHPFEYFRSVHDNPATSKDVDQFTQDLTAGTLPQVSFVQLIGFKSEHPGYGDRISDGVAAVGALLDAVAASSYQNDTLIVLTYDESGGYFDHVSPPPTSTVDCQPYGARVPTLAIGPFARQNFVSHVTMEHSSIVKFIEWNWLGAKTGQLGGRDAVVNNLGSLLDPAMTGTPVPSQ